MKKLQKFLLFLISAVLLLVAVGCSQGESKFEFSYELERTEYSREETIEISATFVNVGRAYKYIGSSSGCKPFIRIVRIQDDGWGYEIPYVSRETEDRTTIRIKKGESRTSNWSIKIPNNAMLGEYSLIISFGGSFIRYQDVLTIVE